MRGTLPPLSVGTSSPSSGEMLAAQPRGREAGSVPSQRHVWHPLLAWKDTAGLLSGGSPLKCQPLTHNPEQAEDCLYSTLLLLLPRALPLRLGNSSLLASKSSNFLGTLPAG